MTISRDFQPAAKRAGYILLLNCPDAAGIVASISQGLFSSGFNIVEAQQFSDPETGRFFLRVAFQPFQGTADLAMLNSHLAGLSSRFSMHWQLRRSDEVRRTLIMVSKFDHCLVDLLYRNRIGELPMQICAIVSNHPDCENVTGLDVPYIHLPVTKANKAEQETRLIELIEKCRAELVILARYMQILSRDLVRALEGRCINIHHSFLPSFKGALPYHQAHERGVKMIGATAHYVTSDLDEGPIIDQGAETITHRDTPDDLVRKGRDIERRVLASAVRLHLEDRVCLNGRKTVVFAA